jgi:hypothetical protein
MSTTGQSGLPGPSWGLKKVMLRKPELTEDGIVEHTVILMKEMGRYGQQPMP